MEHAYAQALWEVIERGSTPARAVRALHEALVRQGRAALMPRIARAFSRIAERARRKKTVTISIARERDARAKKEAGHALRDLTIPSKEFEVRTDDTLIGGWRAEGRGMVIDASFKKTLLDVYNGAVS